MQSPEASPSDPAVAREAERERAARANEGEPSERERRMATRTAYRGLSREEAIGIAKDRHPDVVLAPAWRAPSVAPGQRLDYVSDHAARVTGDDVGGRGALVVSPTPLRAVDDEGRRRPVDLGLEAAGDELRAANPLTSIRIGRRLPAAARLARTGVAATPDVPNQPEAVVVQDTAFYANAATDTDYIVKPTPGGFESSFQLRSADSPEQVALRLDPGSGRTLERAPNAEGLHVEQDGRKVASVSAPVAWDADRRPVPVQWRLDGDRMVIDVAHREKDFAYPLLVDPAVSEWYDWERNTGGEWGDNYFGWDYFTNNAGAFWHWAGRSSWLGNGMFVRMLNWDGPSAYVSDNQHGMYSFRAPGTAKVWGAEWNLVDHDYTQSTCLYVGIRRMGALYDPAGADFSKRWESCGVFYNWYIGQCYPGVCEPTSEGSPGNAAVWGIRAAGAGNRNYFAGQVGVVYVHLYDDSIPTFKPPDWTTAGATDVLPIEAKDAGLGIKRFKLWHPTDATWTEGSDTDLPTDLLGPTYEPDACWRLRICPQSYMNKGRAGNLPQGTTTLRGYLADPAGNEAGTPSTGVPVEVKIDREAPKAADFPNLPRAVGQGGGAGVHDMRVLAEDEIPAGVNAVSGVRQARLSIDGDEQAELRAPAACTRDCRVDATYPFSAAATPPATATDTFTGAAGTLLQSHAPAQGGAWIRHGASRVDAVITSAGRVRRTQKSPYEAIYTVQNAPSRSDYDVSADLHQLSDPGSSDAAAGVIGRVVTSGTSLTAYGALYYPQDRTWRLVRFQDGYSTTLGSYTAAATLTSARVTLSMRGSSLALLVNGVVRVRARDTALAATGAAGLLLRGMTRNSDTADIHLDNFSAQVPGATEGRHTLGVVAMDGATNQRTSSRDVIVDRTPPSITRADGTLRRSRVGLGIYELDVEATDAGLWPDVAGVDRIEVWVDDRGDAAAAQRDHVSARTEPGPAHATLYRFDSASRGPGTYDFTVKAYDAAKPPGGGDGNPAAEQRFTVRVDNVRPRVQLSGSATQTVNPGPNLRIDATDRVDGVDGTGVKSVEVLVDGVRERLYERDCTADACPQDWAIDHAIDSGRYAEGAHQVQVVAKDLAGNAGAAATQSVYVTRLGAIDRSKLGLENFFHYQSTETGAGSRLHVNAHTGNVVWHSVPVVNAGRGLSSVVNLTYNSHDRGGVIAEQLSATGSPVLGASLSDLVGLAYGEAGHGFSVGISGLTRLNEPLAGATTAMATGRIVMTDPDGTAHTFTDPNHDGIFDEPPGVHLRLRRYSDTDPLRRWAITRPDGVTSFFDADGYATRVQDRNGNIIEFEYQTFSKVTGDACPVDPAATLVCGRRVINVVDAAGVEDPLKRSARSIHVEYWPGGVLSLPEGTTTVPSELAVVGGRAGRIRTIVDHADRLTKFDYDNEGYLTKLRQGAVRTSATTEDASGERAFDLTYTGSGPNRVLDTVADPRSATTNVDYEALPAPAIPVTTTSVGRRVTTVNDRRNSRFGYTFTARPEEPGGMLMTLADPARGNLLSRTDAVGRPRILTDGRGTETRLEFGDGDNNVTQLTEAADQPEQAVTTMAYNAHGQLTSQTDAEQRLTTLQYRDNRGTHIAATGVDAEGAWVSDLQRITPPRGNFTNFTLDPSDNGNVVATQVLGQPEARTTYGPGGVITHETDEAANTTRYEDYDDNGLPRRMFDARDQGWEYTYDAVGNVLTQTDPRGTTTADADDFRTELDYDPFDRVVSVVTPRRSELDDYVTRSTTYDANGNTLTEVDGNGHTTTYAYTAMDERSREESPPVRHFGESQPASEVTTTQYDAVGRLSTQTAPNGAGGETGDHETEVTYDGADNVVVERRLARTRPAETPAQLVTSMAYDRRNNVVGVADPRQNAAGGDPITNASTTSTRRWTYTYDRTDNRRTSVEDPGGLALTTEFTYDGNENLATEISPRGFAEERITDFTTTYGYDNNDLITSVGIGDRMTQYERRGDGRITAKVAPKGVASQADGDFRTTYEYLPTGELRRWTLPRADGQYGPADRGVTYTRNAVGDPIQITDPRNRTFTNEFLDTGELRTTQRPSWWKLADQQSGEEDDDALDPARDTTGRALVERSYDEWLHEEDSRELPESEGHGDFGAVEAQEMPSIVPRAGTTSFEYDDEMRVTGIVDVAGRRTQLVRDAVGRVTEERRPLAEDLPDLVTAYSYDRNGNLRQAVDAEGQATTLEYDEYDRQIVADAPGAAAVAPAVDQPGDTTRQRTEMRYDANGLLTQTITPRGPQLLRGYDNVDRLVRDTNGAGGATSFAYDANGNQTLERRPLGNVGATPDNRYATQTTYNQFDEPVSEADGLGNQTTFGYDRNGNQTTVAAPGAAIEPGATPVAHVIEWEFDGRDLPWTERTGTADASRRVTVTEFDPNGNLRRVVKSNGVADASRRPTNADVATQAGPPTPEAAIEATVYDHSDDGLVTSEWLPRGGRDAADGVQWQRTLERDARGRVVRLEAPFADGQPRSTRTLYTHFDTGWIRTARDQWYPGGGDTPIDRQTSTYEYDRMGRQTAWLSSSGRQLRRAYYPNGQLRQRRAWRRPDDPSPRSYSYGYNPNGSMTQTRDFELNRLRAMEHDGAERTEVVDERWQNGRDTAFRHDPNGNALDRWTDAEYLGRNSDGTVNVNGGKRTTFTYDVLDREATMRVSEAGRPNRDTTSTYWPSGELRSRTKPNNTVEDWHYFDDGTLNRMRRHRATAPPDEFAKNQPYHYDENGNRDVDERGMHEFNARDQLVRWTPVWGGDAVQYEVNGSGTTVAETVGALRTEHHIEGDRLEYDAVGGVPVVDYRYDANGNLESIDRGADGGPVEVDYDYDEFSRMTHAGGTDVAHAHDFFYDGLDRRDFWCRDATGPDCGGAVRLDMSYLGTTERVSRERAPGGLTRTYDYDSLMQAQGQDADTAASPGSFTYRPYTKDANGSVEGLEDANGDFGDNAYQYTPYGEMRDAVEPAGAAARDNPIRFEGFYYDAGLQNYDMQARPYRPEIGRFLTEDRYEAAAGDLNLQSDQLLGDRYAFVGGNPVNEVEQDGHQRPCRGCSPGPRGTRGAGGATGQRPGGAARAGRDRQIRERRARRRRRATPQWVVYEGIRNGRVVYVGITTLKRFRSGARLREHNSNRYRRPFSRLRRLRRLLPLNWWRAHFVEQALIRHYGFKKRKKNPGGCRGTLENLINSISPRRTGYRARVNLGRLILATHGYVGRTTPLRC